MFNASAVLPIDGRAARSIKSDFCKPFVTLSSSISPVGTPRRLSGFVIASYNLSSSSSAGSFISTSGDFF